MRCNFFDNVENDFHQPIFKSGTARPGFGHYFRSFLKSGNSKPLSRNFSFLRIHTRYLTTSIRATSYYLGNEILSGRTNRGDALYKILWYEGARFQLSCKRWSYYSGRCRNRREGSKRGSRVYDFSLQTYLYLIYLSMNSKSFETDLSPSLLLIFLEHLMTLKIELQFH